MPKKHLITSDVVLGAIRLPEDDLMHYYALLDGFNTTYDNAGLFPGLNPGVNKPFNYNENGFEGEEPDIYVEIGWRYMMAGGAMYNNLDYSFTVGHEDGTGTQKPPPGRRTPGSADPKMQDYMAVLLDFMNSIPLVEMKPMDEIIVSAGKWGGHALGKEGRAYAFMFVGEVIISPVVNLPAGEYVSEWIDVRTGQVKDREVFAHAGGDRGIKPSSPSLGVGALRIFRKNATGEALPSFCCSV